MIGKIGIGLVLLLSLGSCEEPEPEVIEEMTCMLNGSPWVGTNMNHTLLRIQDSTPTGKRLDLRAKALGVQIILTCGVTPNSAGNVIPTGTYNMGNSGGKEGLITLLSGISVEAVSSGYGEDVGYVTITSMDSPTQRCSGTFAFKAKDLGTDEIIYEGTEGVFTNLKYTVQ